jgi:hypothetical protein
VVVAATLAITLLAAAIFNDRHRAGFFVLVVVLFLLSSDERLAVALVAIGALLLVEGIARRGRPLMGSGTVTKVMTAIAVIVAIAVGLKLNETGSIATAAADLASPALPALGQAKAGSPDIYLFLLDAYPGDRAARRWPTFDADAFPQDLEARGFDVVRDAHSNYLLTPLTLASMLSMRHLSDISDLDPPYGPTRTDFLHLRAVFTHAEVLDILRAAGYETVVIDGGYAHAQLRAVDRFIEAPDPVELERALMRNTRIDDLIDGIRPGTTAEIERDRIRWSFTTVGETAREPRDRPRFVFVHVSAPHAPWVFEADGSPRDPKVVSLVGEPYLTVDEEFEASFAASTHVADLTVSAIDSVRSASAVEPVVIVMSDHGPGPGFSTVAPLTSDLEIRASNFMAVLAPGHPDLLAERPSPVNLFGTLFAAYFGRPQQRVSDSIYAWPDGGSYLDAVKVPPIDGWPE